MPVYALNVIVDLAEKDYRISGFKKRLLENQF
jgi:hypothetical protein